MRTFFVVALFVLLVGGLSGFAWISQHPEAEWIERAQDWPVVGPAAGVFREKWLPPSARGEGPSVLVNTEDSQSASGRLVARREPEVIGAMPYEWVKPGMVMRESPTESATVVVRFDLYANLTVYDRQGEWARLRHGEAEGWVRLPQRTEPLLGSAPAPNLPLLGQPPEASRLAVAQRLLGLSQSNATLGPYPLWTDVEEGSFLEWLGVVANSVDAAYRQRYRRRPIGEPAEAILLFSQQADYRRFQALDSELTGLHPAGHVGHGLVALYTSVREDDEVAETLAHELTHLLNQRALGPALPAWLDEGLAGDLGGSAIGPRGVDSTRMGGRVSRGPASVTYSGTRAALKQTRDAIATGKLMPLQRLTTLGWRRFVSPLDEENNHAHSALFMRYLIDGEEGSQAAALQEFLASVAQGEPATGEALRQRLDRSWRRLDAGFQVWVTQTAGLL